MTVSHENDHVSRLMQMRRREMPGVPLDGMAIFARARRLDQLSRKPIEAVFSQHGLDAGEFDVLASLQRNGPPYAARPTELFTSLMISSGGLTDRLSRLEKKGFVERMPCKDDRRSLLVSLTPKGHATIRSAYAADMAIELDLLSGLNSADRKQLARLLSKLLTSLEDRLPNP